MVRNHEIFFFVLFFLVFDPKSRPRHSGSLTQGRSSPSLVLMILPVQRLSCVPKSQIQPCRLLRPCAWSPVSPAWSAKLPDNLRAKPFSPSWNCSSCLFALLYYFSIHGLENTLNILFITLECSLLREIFCTSTKLGRIEISVVDFHKNWLTFKRKWNVGHNDVFVYQTDEGF